MQSEIVVVESLVDKTLCQSELPNENEGVVEASVMDCRQEDSQESKWKDERLDSLREAPPHHLLRSKVRFDGPIRTKQRSTSDTLMAKRLKTPPRSKSRNVGGNSTSANSPCVFERLSNTQTMASLHRMGFVRRRDGGEKRSSSAPPLRARPKSASCTKRKGNDSDIRKFSTKNSFDQIRPKSAIMPKKKLFDSDHQKISSLERLAGKHTALSSSRQRREESTPRGRDGKSNVRKNPPQRNRRKMRSASQGRSPMERWESAPSVVRIRKPRNEINDDYSVASTTNSIGPPLVIEFSHRMKLLSCNTHRPEDHDVEIDPTELGVDVSITAYEAGVTSMKEMASDIMVGMFLRDLTNNREWEIGQPLDRELSMPIGEKGYSFFIEANTKNLNVEENDENQDTDKDTGAYSVSATANVIFVHESLEILVENYSFVRDGLKIR